MTRAKISEYSATANDNTDVNGINIAEGCPPSSMNNMGREIMAALKRFQVGSDGDGVTVGGSLVVSGSTTANTLTAGPVSVSTLNTSGQVVFNDAGADVDFRVEGDTDANLVFVDASTDRVGVGTGSPAYKLDVIGPTGASIVARFTGADSTGLVRIDATGASTRGGGIDFLQNTSLIGRVGVTGTIEGNTASDLGIFAETSKNILFYVNGSGSATARITSDGYLRMASGSGGIQFGGDTAAANALDDYEEGTWTPTLVSSGATWTYNATRQGYYTKVGRVVTVNWYIFNATAAGTTSNDVYITGCPFTSIATDEPSGSCWLSNNVIPAVVKGQNSTQISLFRNNNDGFALTLASQVSGRYFIGSVTYFAA